MNGQIKETKSEKAEKLALIILSIILGFSALVGFFFASAIAAAVNS